MIPEGWQNSTISEVSSVPVSYGIVQTGEDLTDGIPCVRVVDIASGILSRNSMIRTRPEISSSYSRTVLKRDDIMIALRGIIGYATRVTKDLEGCNLTRGIARISPKADVATPDFLHQALNGPEFRKWMNRQASGSALQEISIATLRKSPILLPPLPEQRRIADILSAWDEAIKKVEALIANARAQKQALMQQLLSGTTRFPRFFGSWEKSTLADLGTISSAGVDKEIVSGEQSVRLLNFLDAYRREFIRNRDLTHVVTAPQAKILGCDVRKGDIFFTPSSETRHDIALAAVAAEDMPGVVYSYHVVRFRPLRKIDLKFSAYLFQTDYFRRQSYRMADGSGQRYVISQQNFRKMEVLLPPLQEQAEIGGVLEGQSAEIEEYEHQLTALRQEKAALMQQLLTGKRRVKLNDKDAS